MPTIRWANDRDLRSTLGEEQDAGGRLDNAYGTETSLQFDEDLFRRSATGNSLFGGGDDSHFNSGDLASLDFGREAEDERNIGPMEQETNEADRSSDGKLDNQTPQTHKEKDGNNEKSASPSSGDNRSETQRAPKSDTSRGVMDC